jgi:hypothetical protein
MPPAQSTTTATITSAMIFPTDRFFGGGADP